MACNSNMNSTKMMGRGPELKYEFYFPENACLFNYPPDNSCQNNPYPLQNVPSCAYPCKSIKEEAQLLPPSRPIASELYGDALRMNGGNDMFYYHDQAAPKSLTAMTYGTNIQPYHYQFNPAINPTSQN